MMIGLCTGCHDFFNLAEMKRGPIDMQFGALWHGVGSRLNGVHELQTAVEQTALRAQTEAASQKSLKDGRFRP